MRLRSGGPRTEAFCDPGRERARSAGTPLELEPVDEPPGLRVVEVVNALAAQRGHDLPQGRTLEHRILLSPDRGLVGISVRGLFQPAVEPGVGRFAQRLAVHVLMVE